MKKKLLCMLLAATMTLSLAACTGKKNDPAPTPTPTGSGEPSTSPTGEPSAAPTDEPTPTNAPETVNFSVKELLGGILDKASDFALMELGETELKELYGIDAAKLAEYSVMVPMMNVQATEFAMFQAASAEDVAAIKAGIDKRIADLEATWGQYLADQMELVENRKVLVQGNYIFFIVAEPDISDYAENVFLRQFDPSIEEYVLLRKFDRLEGAELKAISQDAMTLEWKEGEKTYTFEGTYSEAFYVEGDLADFAAGDKVAVVFEEPVAESESAMNVVITYLEKITE